MNERINELFGKALDEVVPETWTTLNPAQLTRLKEKFSELIVRECMTIAKNWEDQLENANSLSESNAVGIVAYRIARQFGVEE